MTVDIYCGWESGTGIDVGGTEAILTFRSDDYNGPERGFFLSFTAVQPCKCDKSVFKTVMLNRA